MKSDLSAGMLAAERVLQSVNEAVERDRLDGALEDLSQRVTDWKTHQLDQFGKLILHGTYAMSIGSSDKEKDVRRCGSRSLLGHPSLSFLFLCRRC